MKLNRSPKLLHLNCFSMNTCGCRLENGYQSLSRVSRFFPVCRILMSETDFKEKTLNAAASRRWPVGSLNRTRNLIGFHTARSQWGGYSQSEHTIKVRHTPSRCVCQWHVFTHLVICACSPVRDLQTRQQTPHADAPRQHLRPGCDISRGETRRGPRPGQDELCRRSGRSSRDWRSALPLQHDENASVWVDFSQKELS